MLIADIIDRHMTIPTMLAQEDTDSGKAGDMT